jgi:fatty-acyl-CoA synthase
MEIDYTAADYVNQRQLALGELLSRQARIYPEREALVFEGRTYTYRDFDRRTDQLANAMAARGVVKDGKAALLFFNCSEMVEVIFAVCKLGAVNVPLNFRLKGQEILYQLTDSESVVTFFGNEFIAVIEEIRAEVPDMRFVCVGAGVPDWAEPYEDFLASGDPVPPGVAVFDDDPAFIMYTSGTTGRPKGAVLTHKNQLMNVFNCLSVILTVLDEIEQEKVQFVGPLFHEAALALCLVTIFQAGAMHILRFFEPEKIMAQIQEFKLTSTFLPPVMSTFLLSSVDLSAYDTSSLRIYISGAAILPTETRRQINAAFPNVNLFDVFGQTEMSPVTTILKPIDAERKTASVGKAVLNIDIRVVDEDDNDVPQGDVGEIIYRGPTVMKEYYRKPEETAETLRGGWFHSGDMVRLDEEGFYYVVDRKKDMIVSGGENIYPAEIEEVLYQHPKILEVAVIGIFDEEWGESVMAVVVPKPGEEMTADEVVAWCADNLASYKKPKRVDFIEALPRNAAMKVLKTELRATYGKSIRY